MGLRSFLEVYKYVLKFHPIKYLGIIIMIFGPLYVIYRFIFLNLPLYMMFTGVIGSLLMGSYIWSLGWDPYG